ncbi:MAG: class I SAM-dependent methyltransferase [Pirellulales bacterium]
MTQSAEPYRWNTSAAAESYDRAAPAIHPHYTTVQDQVLAALPFDRDASFLLVDLGGGSGRFVERFLERFSNASAVIVDQSEPFLAIAERRTARFGPRAKIVQSKLQDDWDSKLATAPQAIVSMSAIHHLVPAEKRTLYARCYEALAPGGVFANGDEYRPESDTDFRALLERWSTHMQSAINEGRVPAEFQPIFDHWHNRNLVQFGTPKTSGDDCQETIAVQRQYLISAEFTSAELAWSEQLWAVLRARK